MKTILLSLVLVSSLISCGSTTKQQIAQEKSEVGQIESREEMVHRTRGILNESSRLSKAQKNEFLKLHSDVMEEVAMLNNQIRQEKVVLFNSMFSQNYNDKKVELLKASIKKLHNKKYDVMMGALDESRKILGVEGAEFYEKVYEAHDKL